MFYGDLNENGHRRLTRLNVSQQSNMLKICSLILGAFGGHRTLRWRRWGEGGGRKFSQCSYVLEGDMGTDPSLSSLSLLLPDYHEVS